MGINGPQCEAYLLHVSCHVERVSESESVSACVCVWGGGACHPVHLHGMVVR